VGRIKSVSGQVKQFVPRTKQPTGEDCKPSEVDDWTALLVRLFSADVDLNPSSSALCLCISIG
jgi:hypothetical protein